MNAIILQARLPFAPWTDPRSRKMPGVMPLDPDDWLQVDDAYAAQMALRDRLIAEREAEVHALLPQAQAAARELYDSVLPRLPALGFRLEQGAAIRPDGVRVALDPSQPLMTLGRLCQEDFCLMQEDAGGEHLLTGAILCFPAGWRLDQKLGRALLRIHLPVGKYDEDIARRVQRLFDAIRPEQPLWRANAHFSGAPLFNPLPEGLARSETDSAMPYIRSERQCLLRLPQSRAVVFSIHTYLVREDDLTAGQRSALKEFPIHRSR